MWCRTRARVTRQHPHDAEPCGNRPQAKAESHYLVRPCRQNSVRSGIAENNTDPAAGYRTYVQPPGPDRTAHNDATARRAALTICTIADVAAGLLGPWIALYLLDANQASPFVEFVHGTTDRLSGWARDIFTMDTEGLRVVLTYGLPAVVHLLIGHGIAARINRA